MGSHRVALSVMILVAIAAGSTEVRAECQRAAVPDGDPTLVRTLTARLSASGIATTQTSGCPTVRVTLEQRGEQVHLRVTDGYQRLGERDVRDIATAAAIIESWTLQEIEEGALPAEAPPSAVAPIAAAGPARAGLAVAAISSYADDGTLWLGLGLSGCWHVGWSCIGMRLDVARDTNATGATNSGNPKAFEGDAFASIDLPRPLGGFVITPGAMVGYGLLDVTATHMDAHMMKFDVSVTSHELRVGAHAGVSHAIGSRFAVYGDVVADGTPLHTAITGGPRAWLSLVLGCRVEMP